jgi:hypothetical protein
LLIVRSNIELIYNLRFLIIQISVNFVIMISSFKINLIHKRRMILFKSLPVTFANEEALNFRLCLINKHTSLVITAFEESEVGRFGHLKEKVFLLIDFKANFICAFHHEDNDIHVVQLIVNSFVLMIVDWR